MWWKPPLWVLYAAIVFEIAFMISPFAIYFYTAYAPFLNFLGSHSSTAWLAQFFLPHFSRTSSPLLEALSALGGVVLMVGLAPFALGTVPDLWVKAFPAGSAGHRLSLSVDSAPTVLGLGGDGNRGAPDLASFSGHGGICHHALHLLFSSPARGA